MANSKEKLQTLADIEGTDVNSMLEDAVFDSVCACICMNEGCDATYDYEPDCTEGWCDECQTNSVKSCLVLAGLI